MNDPFVIISILVTIATMVGAIFFWYLLLGITATLWAIFAFAVHSVRRLIDYYRLDPLAPLATPHKKLVAK